MPDGSTHQYTTIYQAPGAGWARKIIDDLVTQIDHAAATASILHPGETVTAQHDILTEPNTGHMKVNSAFGVYTPTPAPEPADGFRHIAEALTHTMGNHILTQHTKPETTA